MAPHFRRDLAEGQLRHRCFAGAPSPAIGRSSAAVAVSGLSAPDVHCQIMQHERGRIRAASGDRQEGTVTRCAMARPSQTW